MTSDMTYKQNKDYTLTYKEGKRETIHTHFDVSEEAETLKKVALDSEATALASKVFPVPGGPKSSKPEKKYLVPILSVKKCVLGHYIFCKFFPNITFGWFPKSSKKVFSFCW